MERFEGPLESLFRKRIGPLKAKRIWRKPKTRRVGTSKFGANKGLHNFRKKFPGERAPIMAGANKISRGEPCVGGE